jgi:integrase
MGKISVNFGEDSFSVKGSAEAVKERETYEADTLKGVFSKEWNSELSRVLCMTIYFTGLRNSEIQRMTFNDIQPIDNVFFLNVRGTKSKNAKRKVPIHPVLYNMLEMYVKENGIDFDTPIFQNVYNSTFRRASFDMGKVMNHSESELLEKGICFYSGRHSYCSCLSMANADNIADIPVEAQQIFGGHGISKKALAEKGIKQYDYIHFNSNSFIFRKGKEVLRMIEHYYL